MTKATVKVKMATTWLKENKGKVEELSRLQLATLDALIDEYCLTKNTSLTRGDVIGNCDSCPLGDITSCGDLCLKITNLVIERQIN